MSFLKKASLLTIPTAYKQGKLYSIKPDDGTGDFTFTRSTSATRVNSDGLIEKERENLLLHSNDFNQWSKLNATATSSQNGYDGTNDAWLLTDTSVLASHRVYIANSHSGVYTFSVYAKAGTKSIVYIQSYINNNSITYFDLAAGSVLSATNNIHSKIEAVGNGWYRCSMAFDNINAYVTIGMADSATANYLGDGTGTLLIQDAQLEQGLVATDYIETTTTTVSTGIVENVPRIDYSSSVALLLEPQRTNLVTNSEVFTASANGIVELNADISPDGFQNAVKVTFGNIVNDGCIFPSTSPCSPNTVYTFSGYVKSISGNGYFNLRIDTNATPLLVNEGFYATNQWTRFTHTFTTDGTSTSFIDSRLRPSTLGVNNEILFYGLQLEEGSYATSYIPTYGTSVTRIYEQTNILDLGITGQDVTHFVELDNNLEYVRDVGSTTLRWSDVGNNLGSLRIYRAGSNARRLNVVFQDINGNFPFNIVFINTDNAKVAIKRVWATGEIKVFVNGVLEFSDTSTDFSTWNKLEMEGRGSSISVKSLLSFPTALSDVECITLTTI